MSGVFFTRLRQFPKLRFGTAPMTNDIEWHDFFIATRKAVRPPAVGTAVAGISAQIPWYSVKSKPGLTRRKRLA